MASKKSDLRVVARRTAPQSPQQNIAQPPTVSPRWLLTALTSAVLGAVLCAWGALCLLFWQGNWQLLYHPKSQLDRTPASLGIPFESVGFAATETGQLRIQGWWIPANQGELQGRFTFLNMHGATGNIGDAVDKLGGLHSLGVNILAFDYRGYGQSQFGHPGERRWLEDAHWALEYLTQTRHIDPHSIVLDGDELGADLAVEVAAMHPDLAGVVVRSPIEDPVSVILKDSRAHLVPAHLLVTDRYDLDLAAKQLRIPSLWLLPSGNAANAGEPSAFGKLQAPWQLVQFDAGTEGDREATDAVSHWLTSLPKR